MEKVKGIELSVLERITLVNLLPAEGNRVTYKILHDLKSDISFTPEEIKEFEMKVEMVEGKVNFQWNAAKVVVKEIEISDPAEKIIVEVLTKLEKEKKINDQNVSLYDKFISE